MIDETIERSREIFNIDYAGLTMTVKHDDGQYRHLVFASPDSGCYWFEIATWPGHLWVGGGIDGYVFAAACPDMFGLFTRSRHNNGINAHYWAQKISSEGPSREFSPEKFKTAVVEDFLCRRHRYPGERAEIWRAVLDIVLDADTVEIGDAAKAAVDRFEHRTASRKSFAFDGWYEWDIEDWSPHFLRACFAVVFGIDQYRKAKAEAVTA